MILTAHRIGCDIFGAFADSGFRELGVLKRTFTGMGLPMGQAVRDVELLARAQAGEGEAFGLIFRRHVDAVYNYCFRRLGSWSGAEDAASLVFLETWRRRRDAVDSDGSLLRHEPEGAR